MSLTLNALFLYLFTVPSSFAVEACKNLFAAYHIICLFVSSTQIVCCCVQVCIALLSFDFFFFIITLGIPPGFTWWQLRWTYKIFSYYFCLFFFFFVLKRRRNKNRSDLFCVFIPFSIGDFSLCRVVVLWMYRVVLCFCLLLFEWNLSYACVIIPLSHSLERDANPSIIRYGLKEKN